MLIIPQFVDGPACHRVRLAMDAGAPEPAEILHEVIAVDGDVRRAVHIEVDDATLALVEQRLDDARERIERFFRLRLREREGASILRYPPGGFFKPHRDWGNIPSWPNAARRQIAVVVFLNTSRDTDPSGTFSGGTLRLFPGDDTGAPLDVHPSTGTLVAFPATTLHEVTVVRDGIRDSVVDWYY